MKPLILLTICHSNMSLSDVCLLAPGNAKNSFVSLVPKLMSNNLITETNRNKTSPGELSVQNMNNIIRKYTG